MTYMLASQIRRFGLRTGDTVEGPIRALKKAKDICVITSQQN